jgi:CO dehydrogenase maturation factor
VLLKTNKGRVIAVTGKGGVGKTALVAIMVKILVRNGGLKVLVIDADSAISLPQTLGVKVDRTVGDVRREIIENPEERGKLADTHIRTVISSIVKQQESLHLLVMGRGEGPGCYCAINDLLKYGIETLSRDFAVTIVDGEAGPEQINRRVLENVDTLIIVTDTSARSIQTASSIKQIAQARKTDKLSKIGLVINRMTEARKAIAQIAQQIDTEIWGYIPEDENIAKYDLTGKPIVELPDSSPSVIAVEKILRCIGINGGGGEVAAL